MWLIDLIRSELAKRRGVRVKEGDHVRALEDLDEIGLVYFKAPFSTGFRCTIPKGSVPRVYGVTRLGFVCTPEGKLEAAIVPEHDRRDDRYAGAAFSFTLADLGRRLVVQE